jgi:hypothetical protein
LLLAGNPYLPVKVKQTFSTLNCFLPSKCTRSLLVLTISNFTYFRLFSAESISKRPFPEKYERSLKYKFKPFSGNIVTIILSLFRSFSCSDTKQLDLCLARYSASTLQFIFFTLFCHHLHLHSSVVVCVYSLFLLAIFFNSISHELLFFWVGHPFLQNSPVCCNNDHYFIHDFLIDL